MKSEFYISEFASLLNISDNTLRYYDKIGLLKPANTIPGSNYRKYTLDQIWALERIRYFQSLGLNLDEIKSVVCLDDVTNFVNMLNKKREELSNEIDKLSGIKDCIDEYLQYYRHINETAFPDVPYISSDHTRFVLVEHYQSGEPLIGTAGPRLLIKKARDEFSEVKFLRQIGFILDYDSLLQGNILPTHYFIFLKEKPGLTHPDIIEISAGRFICFRGKIISRDYSPPPVNQFFKHDTHKRLVLAIEHESTLDTSNEAFKDSMFEVQIML